MKTNVWKKKVGGWLAVLAAVFAGAAAAGGDEWDTSSGEWNADGSEWSSTAATEEDWDAAVEPGSEWDATPGFGSPWNDNGQWTGAQGRGGEWEEVVARLKANTLKLRFRGALGTRLGAGFLVDTNGWVLTNLSIAEGAKQGYAETVSGEKLPIKRVLGMSTKFNLLLLDLGGDWEDALELADDGAIRPGMEAHAIGVAKGWGWMDLAGVVTRVGLDDAGDPLVDFSGWRGMATPGGPVSGPDGRVIGIGTWKSERSVELDEQNQRYVSVPTERTGCLPGAVARRFLEAPHSGMALQQLGACHANAEVANWVMYMCSEAKDAMVFFRNEVKAAEMEKHQILDIHKVSFRQTLSNPIHWKNEEGLEAARLKLEDLNALAARSMPLLAATDGRARNSVTYFRSAMRAMGEAVGLIGSSDGLRGDAFWQRYDNVKGKFLQINDFLYKAMQSAMSAYRIYGRYSTQPAYLTPLEARRTLKFLESRGGGF